MTAERAEHIEPFERRPPRRALLRAGSRQGSTSRACTARYALRPRAPATAAAHPSRWRAGTAGEVAAALCASRREILGALRKPNG